MYNLLSMHERRAGGEPRCMGLLLGLGLGVGASVDWVKTHGGELGAWAWLLVPAWRLVRSLKG